MKSKLACGLSLCGLMTAGGAMLAAPGQTTQRPGEMTEARVWVQNRAKDAAVAVTVQDVAPDATMHVARTPEDLRDRGRRIAEFLRA